MKKYLLTPTLLNSWKYAIADDNDYGNLEDFIKVLSREPMEPSEAIITGFKYEDFMVNNYEPTKNGCYQVKLSKNIVVDDNEYVLYGRLDCLKGGKIYDYKYTGAYDVGKFYGNYQTPIYLELVPEASEIEYVICNNFKEDKTLEDLNIYHEVYTRDDIKINLKNEIRDFINWLRTNNLYDLFCEKWESKY